uniref:G-protein coupled receptors family 1 profile domain-containing protein n=1 Tax=Eptatretus burgeri TaxID=7764 RepID=A0A8C4R5C8_EPTBU
MRHDQKEFANATSSCIDVVGDNFEGFFLLLSLKSVFLPLYAFLTTVGVAGNSLLVAVLVRSRHLRTTTNFLLGNLALSDLLMCVTCVPISAAYAFEPCGWVYGPVLCYLIAIVQPTTVYVSVLSLMTIAIDRYVVVAHPIQRRISPRICTYLVVVIWLVSAALASPVVVHTVYANIDLSQEAKGKVRVKLIICEEIWNSDLHRLVYSSAMFVLSFVLPLFAVCTSNLAISVTLRHRAVPGSAQTPQAKRKQNQIQLRTFKLLVIAVVTFVLCWLPLQVFNLIYDINQNSTLINKRYFDVVKLSCHWLAMTSTCWNPFIYALLHRKFATALRKGGFWSCRDRQGSLPSLPATGNISAEHNSRQPPRSIAPTQELHAFPSTM